MVLVFGGSNQGKREFARTLLGGNFIELGDVADWSQLIASGEGDLILPSAGLGLLLASLDLWLEQSYQLSEEDFKLELTELIASFPENTVLVVEDRGQGVVPTDSKMRALREANGRALQFLAAAAGEVYRVLAGQALRLKGGA